MHTRLSKMRNALSMIEVIFVIVVLGIVASIGSEIIAQTYESYIVERGLYRSTSKTELALNQIANRLRYTITDTVVAREGTDGDPTPIGNVDPSKDYTVLQWVSSDADSYNAISDSNDRKPGWSAMCDINATTTSKLKTPGSNIDLASEIIDNLGGSLDSSYIYFPDGNSTAITGGSSDEIDVNLTGYTIWERYKLAWSSYALSIEDGTNGKKDLYLYYNFSPTVGADIGTTKELLLKDVTNLRFMGNSKSIHIKICKAEQVGMDSNDSIHTCKEKVIF